MTSCPFACLGLEISASLDDIDRQWRQLMRHAHPDKFKTTDDTKAKSLNDARDKAKQLFYTQNCENARIEVEKRKRKLFRAVERIFNNHHERLCTVYTDGPFFERAKLDCPPDIWKEAEDIVEYGLGDTRQKLKAAQETILELKQEILCFHQTSNENVMLNEIQRLKQQLESENQQKKILEDALQGLESEIKPLRKRQNHERVVASKTQLNAFNHEVASFIQAYCKPGTSDSFVTTQQMMDAFESQCHVISSRILFSKQLTVQLGKEFPLARKIRRKASRGYRGIHFSFDYSV